MGEVISANAQMSLNGTDVMFNFVVGDYMTSKKRLLKIKLCVSRPTMRIVRVLDSFVDFDDLMGNSYLADVLKGIFPEISLGDSDNISDILCEVCKHVCCGKMATVSVLWGDDITIDTCPTRKSFTS